MPNPYAAKKPKTSNEIVPEYISDNVADTSDDSQEPSDANVGDKSEDTTEDINEVPTGSVKKILDWVGDDKDKAQKALDAELEGKGRATLLTALEEVLNA